MSPGMRGLGFQCQIMGLSPHSVPPDKVRKALDLCGDDHDDSIVIEHGQYPHLSSRALLQGYLPAQFQQPEGFLWQPEQVKVL